MSRHSRRRSDGIALVSVLWLLLLLSGLAATVTSIARINALLAHRGLDVARGEAAADAAINQTISSLSDEQAFRHPSLSDSARTMLFDDIPVSIRVSNEAGRIDINTASNELVLAFLQSQGISEDQSADMLHDLRQFQGRQDDSHGASTDGFSVMTRPDRVLQAVEELGEIVSWRNEYLGCWFDSLTVYSQQADINVGAATPQALAAVQWMRGHRGDDPLTSPTQAADETSNVGGVFRIRASAKVSSDVVIEREWVGRVTGDIHYPALTMLWADQREKPSGGNASTCHRATARIEYISSIIRDVQTSAPAPTREIPLESSNIVLMSEQMRARFPYVFSLEYGLHVSDAIPDDGMRGNS